MRHVDRADQVDPDHPVPVGRIESPKRETVLPRACPDGEDHVVAPAEVGGDLIGRPADRRELGHVGDQAQARRRELTGQFEDQRIAIDRRDPGGLGGEGPRDRRADAPRRPEDRHRALDEAQIHDASSSGTEKSFTQSYAAERSERAELFRGFWVVCGELHQTITDFMDGLDCAFIAEFFDFIQGTSFL